MNMHLAAVEESRVKAPFIIPSLEQQDNKITLEGY